ncbi:unnamed protein product [Notodromas monacha]|uniref:EF-hand domain-containing protein n=1 Tax=Notodromas monacha TaxID=399045 RepID=A0A7R9BHK3_9CRUS|nr:unnamed protein product [Notodromas monacha]CAG0914581.1 unnamed protein product [Notodromas monacha]
MGNRKSVFLPEQLEEYQDATFFTRKDILRAHRRYQQLSPGIVPDVMTGQEAQTVTVSFSLLENLPELKENPFRKRLCQVFSRERTGDLTFDEFLDMMSALSEDASHDIRVAYAFRMFDYDNDGFIGPGDLQAATNELTNGGLADDEVKLIALKILEEGDIDDDGKLSQYEFQNVIERSPDFMTNFHIRF